MMFLLNDRIEIALAGGGVLPAKELDLGMLLASPDRMNMVVGITRSFAKEFVVLYYLNGDKDFQFTGDMIFKERTKGWVARHPRKAQRNAPDIEQIGYLLEGDEIKTSDGWIKVESIEQEYSNVPRNEFLEIELDGDHLYYINGYLTHNKGGGGGGTQTTIQKTEPPKYLKPYLIDIAKKAQSAYNKVPQGGFQGDLMAEISPLQQQAINEQKSIIQGLDNFGAPVQAMAQQQAGRVLGGDILAPANDAFQTQSVDLSSVISAAIDPIARNMTEQILPQIQSQAIMQGAYGGSRQDIQENQAVRDFQTDAMNLASGIAYEDFTRQEGQRLEDTLARRNLIPELERLQQAAVLTTPDLIQQGLNMELAPSNMLAQIGEQERLFEQEKLDEAYQRYMLDTQAPFAGLDNYAGIIAGIPSGQTSTLTGPRSGGGGGGGIGGAAMGALGGLGMMASLGSFAPLAALGGPAGLAAGAILGGLLGGFG